MPSLPESLDALDRMVTNHAATPEIRSQIAYITREVATLEAEFVGTVRGHAQLLESHTKLQQAQLARDRESVAENRHRVRVTLTNGLTRYYDADTYEIIRNNGEPNMVEIRKTDKANHIYHTIATARWSEVAEVHKPEG